MQPATGPRRASPPPRFRTLLRGGVAAVLTLLAASPALAQGVAPGPATTAPVAPASPGASQVPAPALPATTPGLPTTPAVPQGLSTPPPRPGAAPQNNLTPARPGVATPGPEPAGATPARPTPPASPPVPPAATAAEAPAAGEPAPASPPAPPAPAARSVRVRGGQHADRGRVVLDLGSIPPHSLRRTAAGQELRLQGRLQLDLAGLRPLRELAGTQIRQEGEETVLVLQPSCADCAAELGVTGGLLYVDLRRGPARPAAAGRDQPREATALPPPAATPPRGRRGHAEPPATEDLTGLRESILGKLNLLNAAPTSRLPGTGGGSGASGPGGPGSAAPPAAAPGQPLPNPRFGPGAEAVPKPPCLSAPFTLRDWAGRQPFLDELVERRAALALSDQGLVEMAALAEFYAAHEMPREALEVLAAPVAESAPPDLQARLERVRDIARILGRQRIDPASALLAEAADCARPDLPLWRGLAAALAGDAPALARQAPQIRALLRDIPPDLRLAFAHVLTDAVEEDVETLRVLVAGVRSMTELRPDQQVVRNWLLSRQARLEGNRADEMMYLERAARGRSVAALYAQARLAALNLTRQDGESQRAEQVLIDFARTYRHDPLGEESAILYAQRLLERGDLRAALRVADEASQASSRPNTESRAARLAAQALRLLLVDARGLTLPPAGERLALYWQYEGYATPGERGDDIRQGAARLMLDQGLPDAALETSRQLAAATLAQPAATLLQARAEALAEQGDPMRALALLQPLPASDAARRIAALALSRLGKPLEGAAALAGLEELPDRQARAALLFQGQAWGEAATAYAALLRDASLDPQTRSEATARLASAAALARQRVALPGELLAPEGSAATLLQLSNQATPAAPRGVAAARQAISRSRQIEQVLPAAAAASPEPASGRN
ncbi:hypothetical protein [Roseomonas sp. USHLN139]|uniref:hypothetical protein n=1 Tax=Roseomonas sp. USHLN139 TaxID=3081298 RepID=UPI003B028138